MLEVRELEVAYGDSLIVQGASLRVDDRQIVALLGRNGAIRHNRTLPAFS